MAVDVSMNGERKKTAKKDLTTLRFDLKVDSPTEDSFSEFSYIQLIRDRRKQKISLVSEKNVSGLHPDDSNEQVASIARNLEEKYGPKSPKKRKRLVNDSDYIDRGCGYDLTDSFVDDSEFYEDFVPDHVDTKYGGFYINAGELEFKAAEDIDEIDFVVKKPKIKKQPSHQTPQAILASQKLKKAKQHAALQKAPSGVKKSLFTSSSHPHLKQPPLKKPCKKVNLTPPTGKTAHPVLPGVPISIGDKSVTVPIFSSTDTASSLSVPVSVESGLEVKNEEQSVNKPPPELPSNLPLLVMEVVTKLKEKVAADQKQEGKVTSRQKEGYNEILLEVESACKSVAMKTRNAVFEYLAHLLGVARGTLTKRMKQLAKKKEDDALEGPLMKLKHAIEVSMPRQIALYEEELKKARAESISSATDKSAEVEEDTKPEDVFDESSLLPEALSCNSELLGGQSVTVPAEVPVAKPKRLPRKKYRWAENEDVKTLLFEVVRVKVQSEESCSRFSREKGEEVINQFLEDKIRPLWPKGWMPKSVLYKITEPVHKKYTAPLPRRLPRKEKQPGSSIGTKKELGASLGSPQTSKQLATSQGSPSLSLVSSGCSSDTVSPRLLGVVQTMLTTVNNSKMSVQTTSPVRSVPRTVVVGTNKQANVKAEVFPAVLAPGTVQLAEKVIGYPISSPITVQSVVSQSTEQSTKPQVIKSARQPVVSLVKTSHGVKQRPIQGQAVRNPSKTVLKASEQAKAPERVLKTTDHPRKTSPPQSMPTTSRINALLLNTLTQQTQTSIAVALSPSQLGIKGTTGMSTLNPSSSPTIASIHKIFTTGASTVSSRPKASITGVGTSASMPKPMVVITGASTVTSMPKASFTGAGTIAITGASAVTSMPKPKAGTSSIVTKPSALIAGSVPKASISGTSATANMPKAYITRASTVTSKPVVCIAGSNNQYNSPTESYYVSAIACQSVVPPTGSEPISSLLPGTQLDNKLHQTSSSLHAHVSVEPSGSNLSPQQKLTPMLLLQEGRPTVIDNKHLGTSQNSDYCTSAAVPNIHSSMNQIFVEHSYLKAPINVIVPSVKVEQKRTNLQEGSARHSTDSPN